MAKIRIRHPELGESTIVDESLGVWQEKGWSKVDDSERDAVDAPKHAAPELTSDESAQTSERPAV